MKLLSYLQAGQSRLGATLADGRIADLNRAFAASARGAGRSNAHALADALVPADLIALLRLGPDGQGHAQDALDYATSMEPDRAADELIAVSADQVTLLPPVPQPPKVVCVARNYAEHAKEAGLQISEIPILFARFANTLVAHGQPVVRPHVSEQLDWEGELAVVIGQRGRYITRERAMDHVAGYSVFNDVTVRDFQFRVTQYTAGKNFAASGPFGPHMVTADEVPDPSNLELVTEVSGQEMQRAHTSDMIFDVPYIIEHVSEFIDLEPGDVLAMGTPSGVGFKRQPARFLVPGDTMRVTVSGIGTLENPVIDEPQER